jgi:hypothetical protein
VSCWHLEVSYMLDYLIKMVVAGPLLLLVDYLIRIVA